MHSSSQTIREPTTELFRMYGRPDNHRLEGFVSGHAGDLLRPSLASLEALKTEMN